MVYKRRRSVRAKRSTAPKARSYAKRQASAALTLKRTKYDGAWLMTTATTAGFWRYQTFSTANIQGFAEMQAVFDEYKICGVKQTWRPRYDSVNAPAAAGNIVQAQAYAHIIMDPASTVNPTGTYSQATVNSFLENGNVKSKTLNRPFSVYFKPKVQMTLSGGTTTTSSKWLKTTDTGVVYTGYHMLLQQNAMDTTNNNVVLDSFITIYVKYRGLR